MRSESLPEQHAQHTYHRSSGHKHVRPAPFVADEDDEAEDEEELLFPAHTPRSAILYQTSAHHQPTRQVTTQAPRAVMVYRAHRRTQTDEHPPSYATSPPRPPRRSPRMHWLVYVGLAMLIMLLGWVSLSVFFQWWQITQDDWHYGRPRTFQVDAVVGHGDSPASPSHFLALNLSGHIEIIEFPGGDATHAKVYQGPTLIGQREDLAVVTLRFKDVNGDGQPDMLVSVQESTIVFLNEHGQFRPLKAGEHVTV
ncbi:MAG TPA: hypothetical protein VIY29_28080 [Ktedonobacteraceae bacterium]